jgi:uncharacterized protein
MTPGYCGARRPPVFGKAMKASKWDIVFVQDCNLRCSYCSTGHGRFAASRPGTLSRDLWDAVADFMVSHSDRRHRALVNFQGGETSIHFQPFSEFVTALKGRFERSGQELQVDMATNGVLLDRRRLGICLDMGINLHFSIDGEETKNDLHRRDRAGRGTFRRAFANWQVYRELAAGSGTAPRCTIKSVATVENGLRDIVRFWNAQGVDVVDVILEDKSFYVENGGLDDVDLRRAAYLRDLEVIAAECASRCAGELFLTRFKGPMILFSLWEMMLKNGSAGWCGAGESMLGIDAAGRVFPCNAFIGRPRWQIGHVGDGIDDGALARFLSEKELAFAACADCSVRQFCSGGCPGSADDQALLRHSPGGCEFMKELVGIADASFRSLCK